MGSLGINYSEKGTHFYNFTSIILAIFDLSNFDPLKKDILFVLAQFLLFAAYFGMEWPLFSPEIPSWICYIFIGLTVTGLLVVLLGILNLNENLTPFPSPKSNSTLISTGIYRYVRHPIYAGILLSMLSYALYSLSVFKLSVTAVLWMVLYFKSNYEERMLQDRFTEYKDYMATTGRFFPKRGQ